MKTVEITTENVEPPPWMPDPERLVAMVLGRLGHDRWAVRLLLCDDQRITDLNRSFLGIGEPTDVLAFPSDDASGESGPSMPPADGDVAVSLPAVARNAGEFGATPREEFTRVIIHALLHLLGHTHDGVDLSSPAARTHPMLGLQERLLAEMLKELES